MRIIAGRFKGLSLISPKRGRVRPTTDRVREAIFSVLGSMVHGSRVLDLFAGTGAFGFEALSRGAESATFVDSSYYLTDILFKTVHKLNLENEAHILSMDAIQALKHLKRHQRQFTIVFLDPPYGLGWIERIVASQDFPDVVENGGAIVIEREARSPETEPPPIFRKRFFRVYGDTAVEIFDRICTQETSERDSDEGKNSSLSRHV